MSVYTVFDLTQLQKLAIQFGVEGVRSYEILSGGSENSNYLLNAETGDFVLTLCELKSPKEAEVITNVLSHLQENNFKTSELLPHASGANFGFHNGKPLLLKKYLHGSVQTEFDSQQLVEIGIEIAKLHRVPAPDFLPTEPSYGLSAFSNLDERYPNLHPFKEWLKLKSKEIEAGIDNRLLKSMIHADIFDSNIIMTSSGPIIMDFEEACNYYRVYDIGMAIVGTCTIENTVVATKARQLISGYQSLNDLETLEKEKLQVFIQYAAVATAFWRFKQFNIIVPDNHRKDIYLEMAHIADNLSSITRESLFG